MALLDSCTSRRWWRYFMHRYVGGLLHEGFFYPLPQTLIVAQWGDH